MAAPNMRTGLAVLPLAGLAIGLIGLGLLSVIHRDFALQWEPVPPGVPYRELLGLASGLLLLAGGVLLPAPRTRAWGAAIAGGFIALWVAALHLPHAASHPAQAIAWNAVAESTVMAGGLLLVFRERWSRVIAPLFGVCFVIFGVTHFVYADFTAQMVPAWMPQRLALAYLTGAIHALTGLALMVGRGRRWAAAIEAMMMTSFVLLVHLPRVAAKPDDRLELTLLCVAVLLSSAVWTLATSRTLGPR